MDLIKRKSPLESFSLMEGNQYLIYSPHTFLDISMVSIAASEILREVGSELLLPLIAIPNRLKVEDILMKCMASVTVNN